MPATTTNELGAGILALVDDDAPLLHALTFAFETRGYSVAGYPDAEAALAAPALKRWRCLVLDYRLPGLSGLDLLEQLRAVRLPPPALLITSNPTPAVRARAQRFAVEIIEKPLLDDMLVERVGAIWRAN